MSSLKKRWTFYVVRPPTRGLFSSTLRLMLRMNRRSRLFAIKTSSQTFKPHVPLLLMKPMYPTSPATLPLTRR